MAVGAMTVTTHTEFIPEVWAAGALEAAEFATVIGGRVSRDFEGDIKSAGDTVHVGRISNLTAKTKLSGTANPIEFEAITESKQDITITQHQYAAFLVERILEVQANQDLRKKYEKKIGYALARARDVFLSALFASFTQTVGALGVEPTDSDYLDIWKYFANAGLLEDGVDPGEEFTIFVTPATYAAQMRTSVFISKDFNENAAAVSRMSVGDIYGMRSIISNLLTADGGGYDCAAIHRSAIALCVQDETPVESDYLIQYGSDAVVGWQLYGGSIISYPPETPGGGAAVANRGVLLFGV
jgi:hypothetical protein